MKRLAFSFALLALACTPAVLSAQGGTSLSGPRVGLTIISGDNAERIRDELGIHPVISQIGWQFERTMFQSDQGLRAVSEIVPLLGALEQGKALPSITALVGLRTQTGSEIGIGPNLSLAGVGLAVAGGVTFSAGGINIPVNMAIVPSAGGMRVSILTGFNTERR